MCESDQEIRRVLPLGILCLQTSGLMHSLSSAVHCATNVLNPVDRQVGSAKARSSSTHPLPDLPCVVEMPKKHIPMPKSENFQE
jgi:hypothetical protein